MEIFKTENLIEKGKTIGIFKGRNPIYEKHKHDFIEIVYVERGEAEQRVDDNVYNVKRGDVVFINYGSEHSFIGSEDYCYYNVCFNPEIMGKVMDNSNALALLSLTAFNELRKENNCGKISFSAQDSKDVEFILERMKREMDEKKEGYGRVIENYLSILFSYMLRRSLLPEIFSSSNVWENLVQYISSNPDGELTLDALAKRCFYNPSYFSRVFKQKMGISVSEYVRERRMDKAKSLLQNTNKTVEKIMEEVGYSDRSAFYHAFSKSFDCTPTQIREKK
jgi:AraC-like DNA-binding protein